VEPAPLGQSASQAWRQELADADHSAVLHAIWAVETSPGRDRRYRDLLLAALPPGWEQEEPGHRDKWLWKTQHAAEPAGRDARQVLAAAVAERDLAGARDIPAVVDSRIRRRVGVLVPLPAPAWSQQVPETGDPGRRAYLAEVAALMDARKERIGEHAAASALPWAVSALGPPPMIQQAGWNGSGKPPRSAPTASCPATTTQPTRSAPSPLLTIRTCEPPGTRPWPPSARSTAPTSVA